MTLYQCKKDNHDFRPVKCRDLAGFYADRVPVRRGKIGWKVRFRGTCRYDLGHPDQLDWNKLPGLSYKVFTNHDDAVMPGWRWSEDKKAFELSPYLHIDGNVMKDFEPVEEVVVDQVFYYTIENDFSGNSVQMRFWRSADMVRTYAPFEFSSLDAWSRIIHAWFGGNRTAPKDMHVEYEKIGDWAQDEAGMWWPKELYMKR